MVGVTLLTPLVALLSGAALAAEVDNFTRRDRPLPDSTDALNRVLNLQLRLVVNKANLALTDCSMDSLMFNLQTEMDTNFPAILDLYSAATGEEVRETGPTIYDTPEANAPLMRAGGTQRVINVRGHQVGLDKIDHMLSAGYDYYAGVRKGATEEMAMAVGISREEGTWGLTGTGVKSYADLAANYAGLQLFKDLLEGANPVIQCVDRKWKVTRLADLSPYVNDAMDEAYNCSSYESFALANAVEGNIKKVYPSGCPIDRTVCAKLKASYGKQAALLLHPRCLDPESVVRVEGAREGAVATALEFWRVGSQFLMQRISQTVSECLH